MWRVIFCLALVVILWNGASTALATDTSMRLYIQPQECIVDVLNTGVSQLTTVQPTECQQSPGVVEQVQQASATGGESFNQPPSSLIPSTQSEESQPSVDYGVFQPLVAVLGASQASGAAAVQPIPASVGVIVAVGIVLDVVFFQRRWTRQTWRFMCRVWKKTVALLHAVARL